MFPMNHSAGEVRPDNARILASAVNLSRTFSGIASVAVTACGIVVLVGWIFNIEVLTKPYLSPVSMKANTAIAFVLTGISLWLIQTDRATSRTRFISKSFALTAALIGFLTLLEYIFSFDIGIDQALINDIPNPVMTSSPGRMSPVTAVEFVLLGTALFMIDTELHRRIRPSQLLAVAALVIGILSVFGYVYSINSWLKLSQKLTAIASHTSIAFVAAATGILLARPDKGIMIFFVKYSPGSTMARRLFAAMTLTPLLVESVLTFGWQSGFYGRAQMEAFQTIIVTIIVTSIFLRSAFYINNSDDKRRQAEEERESVARFPAENPNPVIRICSGLRVLYTNKAAKPMLGYLGFQDKGDGLTADKDTWFQLIADVLDSGQVKTVEMPVNDRVFRFTVAPIPNHNYVNLYGYDISEAKAAQNALDYERNKLQNILGSMQDCIVLVRCDLMVEYANNAAIRDFGHFEKRKCYLYLNGTAERCAWCESEKVFDGEIVRREFISHIAGKTYDVIETPITNLDGSISRLGIFRDITKRKDMENKLQLFSQAIEGTIDCVHIINMEGKIIYANKSAAQMTGYSKEESIGMDVVKLVADKYFAVNVIIPAIYVKGVWEGEILCEKKDGTQYMGWLAASIVNNSDGKPVAMIGTLRDITLRKDIEETCRAAEANMTALMNAITESVCLIDINGKFITANDTFAKRFSTDKQKNVSDIVGTNFRDLLTPDVFEAKKEHLDEVISMGLPVTFESIRGESICLTNMYPVFDSEHNVRGIAIYASDITLRKKYENYLLQSIKEKELLMREIHHRVKNNLQIVAGLIGLQLNHITDETYKAMFNETRNRIKSIALVHDKLYGSKGLADVDFKKYILSLSNDLFSSFGVDRGSVTLNLSIENVIIGVDIAVPCGLIVNELFTNILKYAFPDKIIGKIDISIDAKDNGKFEMVVSDNGVGFPEDVDFRHTKSLGLHIVNILVRQISGTIELDRTHGTKFIIQFESQSK
ncbi:MAG: PAS domain S-box protein [Nitrospirota bacterium]